ncbi:ATP-grasp domain-containing protein [bacterium]|nr:ATP-grasp domain-containing protein [bacterium]
MDIRNIVIVWGIDNFNTLGLLRQLGPAGLNLFLLIFGRETGCATSSKYCKEHVTYSDLDEAFLFLKHRFANETHKPIIVTPGDEIIEYIDQHRSEMLAYFIVPGTTVSGKLTELDNKINMALFAKEHGIPIPMSRAFKWNSSAAGIAYPCFLKPSHITKNKKNEFKYRKCNSEKALLRAMKYVRHDSEFLLQEYIPAEKEFVISGCRTMDGKTIIGGCYRTDRYADDGNSSYAFLTAEIPDCIDVSKIRSFLEDMGYYGVFGFEYGLYKGTAYFFEVNLRNNGTSQSFALGGANLVLAWVLSAAGYDYSAVSTTVVGDHFFMDELMDYANVLHGRISHKAWKTDKVKADIKKYYLEDDMQPYIVMKKRRWVTMLRFAVVKRFRLYIVYFMDMIKA